MYARGMFVVCLIAGGCQEMPPSPVQDAGVGASDANPSSDAGRNIPDAEGPVDAVSTDANQTDADPTDADPTDADPTDGMSMANEAKLDVPICATPDDSNT